MMEAIAPALLLAIADTDVSLSSQRLNRLFDQSSRLSGVLVAVFVDLDFIRGGFLFGLFAGGCVRRCRTLRRQPCPSRAHQKQDREKRSHSVKEVGARKSKL